jgi:hypothetical protein
LDTLFGSLSRAAGVNLSRVSTREVAEGLMLTLRSGASIENIYGSNYGDYLVGNALRNEFWGK